MELTFYCRVCEEHLPASSREKRGDIDEGAGPVCKLCVDAMCSKLVNVINEDEKAQLRKALLDARLELETAFEKDMREWRELWTRLERVRGLIASGDCPGLLDEIQAACDLEYGLLLDCEAFGRLPEAIDPDSHHPENEWWWRMGRLKKKRQQRIDRLEKKRQQQSEKGNEKCKD